MIKKAEITISQVLQAYNDANRIASPVTLEHAQTLLEMYVEQSGIRLSENPGDHTAHAEKVISGFIADGGTLHSDTATMLEDLGLEALAIYYAFFNPLYGADLE